MPVAELGTVMPRSPPCARSCNVYKIMYTTFTPTSSGESRMRVRLNAPPTRGINRDDVNSSGKSRLG